MAIHKTNIRKISKKRADRIKNESEKDIFREIWEERPHICEEC